MTQVLRFAVNGLNCASCAVRAQTALSDVDGVRDAEVNFATGRAEVTLSGDFASASLIDALNRVDKPAELSTSRLLIEGMSCASCVNRVETALLKAPGVVRAEVNLASGDARIESLGTPPDILLEAVKSAGCA